MSDGLKSKMNNLNSFSFKMYDPKCPLKIKIQFWAVLVIHLKAKKKEIKQTKLH